MKDFVHSLFSASACSAALASSVSLPSSRSPELGADSDAILDALGYDEDSIIDLKVQGIVF